MLKKLLTIFFLATLTLTTIMPEDILAKGRKGKAVVTRKSGRVAKARVSKGSRKAFIARSKSKSSRYVAKRGKGRRRSQAVVSRAPGVAIPPERVREIQTALKREGYLQIEPSGQYDRTTVEAMTKYQQDNSFRTTGYPTAESLQKLGLTRQRRVTQPTPSVESKPDESSSSSTPPQLLESNR
ncbi:MAG: hypothetical protein FD167_4091 [bacterium]|nr:MAG: hypothetical protein FD167_4091 [bacterium]